MKKFVYVLLAGILPAALLFTGCSGSETPDDPANQALKSAISQYGSTAYSVVLSKSEALDIVEGSLNPEESYTLQVSNGTEAVNGKEFYIVTVSLNGSALSPAIAVDASTGDLHSFNDDKTVGDITEVTFLSGSAVFRSWNGTFTKEDHTASIELMQADSRSFEFSLEAANGGITTKINGSAETDGSTAVYAGKDGLALQFAMDEEAGVLTVSAAEDNTADFAAGYAGKYVVQK